MVELHEAWRVPQDLFESCSLAVVARLTMPKESSETVVRVGVVATRTVFTPAACQSAKARPEAAAAAE